MVRFHFSVAPRPDVTLLPKGLPDTAQAYLVLQANKQGLRADVKEG
jgi:hypothetical protein